MIDQMAMWHLTLLILHRAGLERSHDIFLRNSLAIPGVGNRGDPGLRERCITWSPGKVLERRIHLLQHPESQGAERYQ